MRTDHDALGTVELPDDSYFGVHTLRAVHNFAVSGRTLGDFPGYLSAIAEVKQAAALANADIGVIRPDVASVICQAANEIVAGRWGREQFPVDMMCGGGGVSVNMNVNEVIASRANELLTGRVGYEFVHPNNHVNAGQSTSDALATALNIALHRHILGLLESVQLLADVLTEKIEQNRDVVKLSRTCLQDAVPITFAQGFGAYLAVAQRGLQRLAGAAEACLDVPMGATVVGTGLGVGAGYLDRVYPRLREVTGLPLRRHPNFFDCYQNGDVFQLLSATFKALATNLSKMSSDLRILSSTGMGELQLPAVQAGSSFMPGKVNPVMPELMVQVAYQVCGNDTVVTMGVEGADLDFNAWTGVIAKNLFESCELLTRAIPLFAQRCLGGLAIDVQHCASAARRTLALSAVIGGIYGYDTGAKVAWRAKAEKETIAQAAVNLDVMSAETAAELLDPLMLTDAATSATVLDRLASMQRDKVAQAIGTVTTATKHKLLAVAEQIAAADGRISSQESSALSVVADALSPANATGPIDPHLIYACATWIARADLDTDDDETTFLTRLRAELGLSEQDAEGIHAQIKELISQRRQYLPRAEQLPWWEEFGELLHRIISINRGSLPNASTRET